MRMEASAGDGGQCRYLREREPDSTQVSSTMRLAGDGVLLIPRRMIRTPGSRQRFQERPHVRRRSYRRIVLPDVVLGNVAVIADAADSQVPDIQSPGRVGDPR